MPTFLFCLCVCCLVGTTASRRGDSYPGSEWPKREAYNQRVPQCVAGSVARCRLDRAHQRRGSCGTSSWRRRGSGGSCVPPGVQRNRFRGAQAAGEGCGLNRRRRRRLLRLSGVRKDNSWGSSDTQSSGTDDALLLNQGNSRVGNLCQQHVRKVQSKGEAWRIDPLRQTSALVGKNEAVRAAVAGQKGCPGPSGRIATSRRRPPAPGHRNR